MINSTNKSKVLLLIIAILVVTNIALLVFVLQKKEPEKQSNRPDRKAYITSFLKTEVGFDQQQLTQFDTLSTRHRKNMWAMFEKLKNNKSDQFRQLVQGGFTDSTMNAVADESVAMQKVMELRAFNHLRNIRQLCRPDQLPKFDSGFGKVLNRRGEGRKKGTSNKTK